MKTQLIIDAIIAASSLYHRVVKPDKLWQIRCPICGDSKSNRRTGHMYLFSTEFDGLITYYCHKCMATGQITTDNISQFTSDDSVISLIDNTKTAKFRHDEDMINIDLPKVDRQSPQYKYLISRIGVEIPDDDLNRLRIVTDCPKFFNDYFHDRQDLQNLYRGGIGFLNSDNTKMCARSIVSPADEGDHRWALKNLIKKGTGAPYVIKTNIDIMTTETFTIHIAEGIIDIISIYMNFKSNPNDIYISALGKNYFKSLSWLMLKCIFGTNVNVNCYLDSDVKADKVADHLNKISWMYGKIKYIYNSKAHDFGVHKDQILFG
jgi:hypothetical protein